MESKNSLYDKWPKILANIRVNFTIKEVIEYFLGGPILSFVGQTLQNLSKYIYYIFLKKIIIWGAMTPQAYT